MDTQPRGRKFAIHVLFAGLTCVIASATGFLLTAQSQTIEIWRGSEMKQESFQPAKVWTPPAHNKTQPQTIEITSTDRTPTAANSTARQIMAEAVSAADNGDFEEAIRIAKLALQYEGAWTVNELTPAEFIQNWEAELAFLRQSKVVEQRDPPTFNEPKLVERPTFEPPVEVIDTDQAPAPQAVSNEPVALKVPPFAWEPVQASESESSQESVKANTTGTITADSDESRPQTTETRLASQDSYAQHTLGTATQQPATPSSDFLPMESQRNDHSSLTHNDTRSFASQPAQANHSHDVSKSIPSGMHFNISPNAGQPVVAAAAGEDKNSFYAILAVLSLIFVFGFSLVFLAMFILLKDRGQNQQQDSVLRLDLGSLQGLAQLAQLGGGPYNAYQQQPALAPAVGTAEAAGPGQTSAATSVSSEPPAEEISDEDAMFQHLLEDNIEMYRNIKQMPKAA